MNGIKMLKNVLRFVCLFFFVFMVVFSFMFCFVLLFGADKVFDIIPAKNWYSWFTVGYFIGICFDLVRSLVFDVFVGLAGHRPPARHDSTQSDQ